MDYKTAREIIDSYWFEWTDERKVKRAERIVMDKPNLYYAYNHGMKAFYQGRPKTANPFPPGARHDQWNMGFNYGAAP